MSQMNPAGRPPDRLRDGQVWELLDGERVQVRSAEPLRLARPGTEAEYGWEDVPPGSLSPENVLAGECTYDPAHLTEVEIPTAFVGRRIVAVAVHGDYGIGLEFEDGENLDLQAVWHNDTTAGLYITPL